MSDHYDTVPPEVMDEMRAQAKECEWRETEETGETVSEFIDNKTVASISSAGTADWRCPHER